MAPNRSVPCETVLPHIYYRNIEQALNWLTLNFGFTEHYRYGTPVSGAQIYLGRAVIMLASATARPGRTTPSQFGHATQCVTVFVDDVDAHYARTRTSGANIAEELHETVYGERQYAAIDVEGHLWLFSQHAHDVDPAAWGATVAHPMS